MVVLYCGGGRHQYYAESMFVQFFVVIDRQTYCSILKAFIYLQ